MSSSVTRLSASQTIESLSQGGGADGRSLLRPYNAAYYSGNGTETGYLKITMPTTWNGNTMLMFTVDIYMYGEGMTTLRIGGYSYATGTTWANNPQAHIVSTSPHANIPSYKIEYGHDGSKMAIYISHAAAGGTSTWTYPQVVVRDVQLGLTTVSSTWGDAWTVSFTATLGTITATKIVTNDNPILGGGSGLANRAAFWSDTETITYSNAVSMTNDGIAINNYVVSTEPFRIYNNGTATGTNSVLISQRIGSTTHGAMPLLRFTAENDGGSLQYADIGLDPNDQWLGFKYGTSSSALLNEADAVLKIYNNNYVGIGTGASASYLLDIAGNFRATGNGYIDGTLIIDSNLDNAIQLKASDSSWKYIALYDVSTRKYYLGLDSSADKFVFGSDVAGSQTYYFASGTSVGVGTSTPSYDLHVDGTFGSDAIWTDSSAITYWGNSGTAYGRLTWNTGIAYVYAVGSNALALGAANTETIRINNANNVGIGTSTPAYKLDISGTLRATGLASFDSGLRLSGSSNELFEFNIGTSNLFDDRFNLWPTGGAQLISNCEFYSDMSGFNTYDNNGSGAVTRSLVADATAPNSSGNVMRITYTTGVGTPSPSYGGFSVAITETSYERGDIIFWRILANIPSGRTIEWASNAYGSENFGNWATDKGGIGEWKEYIFIQKIGQTGSFSSTGFFYISGGADATFSWDVARLTAETPFRPEGIFRNNNRLYWRTYNQRFVFANSAGGGTSGYVPYFDSADTFDNSSLYYDGTQFSIDTVTNFTRGGSPKLSIYATSAALSWGVSDNDLIYQRRLATGQYQFQTYDSGNTGEIQLQPYGGSVVIGTNAASDKFHVYADGNADAGIRITNPNVGTSARTRLYFVSDAATAGLYLTSAGYTGVSGWADSFIINSDSSASGGIKLNASLGGIKLSASGSASNDIYVNTSGNVGIGTSSPAYELDVVGDIRARTNLYVGQGGGFFYNDASSRIRTDADFYTNNSNTYIYGDSTYLGSTSGDVIYTRDNVFSTRYIRANSVNGLQFQDDSGTQYMRLNDGGGLDVLSGDLSVDWDLTVRSAFKIQALTFTDITDGILILCPSAGGANNNVAGKIICHRTSGAYAIQDVNFGYSCTSSGTPASYSIYLYHTTGNSYSTDQWDLVSLDYGGTNWIGLRRQGGQYWFTTAYFIGEQRYTGTNSFTWIDTSAATNVTTLTYGGIQTFKSAVTVQEDLTANGAKIGDWSNGTTYKGLFHQNQTDSEYMIMSNDQDTFISASTGYDVYIRGGNNVAAHQIVVFPDQRATASGSPILTQADEGSGNGLDADTLDGVEGASYLRSDASDTYSGTLLTITGAVKFKNAWSSSDLTLNSFYVQDALDGFAFGIGTAVSTWFSWDSTAGVKRAVDVYNDGSKIILGQGGALIGVNTTPTNQLHVVGSGTISRSTMANAHLLVGTQSVGIGMDVNEIICANNQFIVGTSTAHTLEFATNATARAFIDTSGNFYPNQSGSQNLGGNANRWNEFFAVYVGANAGTAAAPTFRFNDDPNTGFYSLGSGNGFSATVDGNRKFTVNDKGIKFHSGESSTLIHEFSGGHGFIPHPYGASLNMATNSITGAIKITFPTHGTADMISFWVDIFDYALGESTPIFISGYLYQTTGNAEWANESVIVLSNQPDKEYSVRFGGDGSNNCIWIGELDSTWSYLSVVVRDFQGGYTTDIDAYAAGWNISIVTSFDTVDYTYSNTYPYAGNSKLLSGYSASSSATANTIALRDSNGDLYMRYGFSEYLNMTHTSSTRSSDTVFFSTVDNYIRKNNATGMRASLNVPTRTGGDASGTWGISITGNADTVDSLHASSFLRSDAVDTASGKIDFDGGVSVWADAEGEFYIRRNQGSTTGDDITSFYQDDAGLNIVIDNENDADTGKFAVYYKSTGNTELLYAEPNDFRYKGNTVWHSGNDGSGSGLDADTLDAVQASSFLRSDVSDTYSGGLLTIHCASAEIESSTNSVNTLQVYQPTSTSDAFMTFHIGSDYAVHFGLDGEYNDLVVGGFSMGTNKYRIWHENNDGSGSGLDADTLDGVQGTSYLRSDVDDTFAADLTITGGGGTIAGATFANGWLQIGSGSQGWAFDSNEFYAAGTCVIGTIGAGTISWLTRPAFNGGTSGVDSPFTVDSTYLVSNLNADLLDDLHSSSFLRADDGNAVNVRIDPANGLGLRFWDSDSYKIWMSEAGDATWGGRLDATSDYNMYFRMGGGTNRGFVFQNGTTEIFQIESTGQIRTASNNIYANGNLVWHAGNDGAGSTLDADLLDGIDSTAFINNTAQSESAASNIAVGWYTIATNTGDRAVARFAVRDTQSGRHQALIFYASHMFGAEDAITVLHNNSFTGSDVISKIRMKSGSTYDGAALQVYVSDASNSLNVYLLGDNFQSSGWVLKDWIPDATDPGDLTNYGSMTTGAETNDFSSYPAGSMVTTGEIWIRRPNFTTMQYQVLTTANVSGTSGYISRSFGNNTISNSIIFEDTGKIGINDTTPSYTLDVNGTGRFTGYLYADSRLYVDNTTNYLSYPTGQYGSIQINGSGATNWEGFSIDGRTVFMHDGGTQYGLYDDVNNQWGFYGILNGKTDMRYAGSVKLETTSTGIDVTGNIAQTGLFLYMDTNIEVIGIDGGNKVFIHAGVINNTTTSDGIAINFNTNGTGGGANIDFYSDSTSAVSTRRGRIRGDNGFWGIGRSAGGDTTHELSVHNADPITYGYALAYFQGAIGIAENAGTNSSRLHIKANGSNPCISIKSEVIDTVTSSTGKTFYGWMQVTIDGVTRYIQLYT